MRRELHSMVNAFSLFIPLTLTVQNAHNFGMLCETIQHHMEAQARADLLARMGRALHQRANIMARAEHIYWEGRGDG